MEGMMIKKLFLNFAIFFAAAMFLMTVRAFGESGQDCTDVVVLSTTDMHGKCWDTNVLTNEAIHNNLLRVSTAVNRIREEYGAENVLLVDNGDLFQGTPVSEVQLKACTSGESQEPLAMALCLKEIGYDAFVLGNHEFNYSWDTMSAAYRYLEENGVPVLAANIVYDGTDGIHEAGENAFRPYVTRTITVGGHEHKIGILGLENTDITRWDVPSNYPGLLFSHPGNPNHSLPYEAGLYIPQMKTEGCEFIITSCHTGLGDVDSELVFGKNTDQQGLRLIREREDIDLLITGHDHSKAYSNVFYENRAGRPVPVVNGGGQDLTKTVLRFSEDDSGNLVWEITGSENLNPADYDTDKALESIIAPYAEMAIAAGKKPLGSTAGDWDKSRDYFLRQTDTIDLVSAAMMDISTERLKSRYGSDNPQAAGITGLDHLDVDMAITSAVTENGYVIKPGDISAKDLSKLYRYGNKILVLPLSGRQIRAVMEENAANRLKERVLNDRVFYYTQGDNYTNLLFGGVNFVYDMSKPAGGRVRIEGFSNGRAFDENAIYLVAVNNYILGNDLCGLRDYSEKDAVWSQIAENNGESIHDIIAEYIRYRCAAGAVLTPDAFTWHWSIDYLADPSALAPYDGETAATLANTPEDGHTYILYHEAEGRTIKENKLNHGFASEACDAYGNDLTAPLPEDVLPLTVHITDQDRMQLSFTDPQGRYLTCGTNGGLMLTDEMADNDLSLWTLKEANGGWFIISAGRGSKSNNSQAIQLYSNCFSTYSFSETGYFIFNFYEPGTD